MIPIRSFAAIIILFTNFHYSRAKNYENYAMYNLYLKTPEHRSYLENLHDKKQLDVIFTEMPPENDIIQVLVNRRMEQDLKERLRQNGIRTKKLTDNAQELFDYKLARGIYRRTMQYTIPSLADVYKSLKDKAAKHPYTELEVIGKSAEDRDIYAFSIKVPPRPNYSNLKGIIEGAIHGNEWLAVSACLHMIDNILNAKTGPYEQLRNKYFLYFIPVLNPDGYEYSLNQDPLWKKNRRKTGTGTYGVNLNRNFPYMFGEYDSSDDPLSDKFRGPFPFSEPETLALKEFLYRKRSQTMFYFSLHGHGQRFILPYSDSVKHLVNFHEVQDVTKKAIAEMEEKSDHRYDVGMASNLLGKRYSGDSASWVKKTYHIPFTITVQLRDHGEQGITLRTEEFEPASEEISHGLTTLMLASGRYRSYENKAAMRNNVYVSLIMSLISLLIFN